MIGSTSKHSNRIGEGERTRAQCSSCWGGERTQAHRIWEGSEPMLTMLGRESKTVFTLL